MKDMYQAARHLVWLTQFGLSIAVPLVVSNHGGLMTGWGQVGVLVGVFGAVSGLVTSLRAVDRQAGEREDRSKKPPVYFNQH